MKYKITYLLILLILLPFVSLPQTNDSSHFYFVQISDTHFGKCEHNRRAEQVVNAVNNLPFDIKCVVITGDIFQNNITNPKAVKKGIDILNKLKKPYYLLPGNHDILENNYDECLKIYKENFKDVNSVAECNGVVFILTFTEPLLICHHDTTMKQLKWLESTLEKYKGKPVIIFHHTPMVDNFYDNKMHKEYPDDVKDKWIKLINSYNVKAVITGHFHRDEFLWLGNIPMYCASSVVGLFGRQASFRIYEYDNGKINYRSRYLYKGK